MAYGSARRGFGMSGGSAGTDPALVDRIASRYRLRRHRSYVRGKLRWDPAFAAVAPLILDSSHALLDIGCGLGLLGQYLRERGFRAPYRGIDLDARKIGEAQAAADGLDLELTAGSATAPPPFDGDVALIDVLHYLPADAQQRVLAEAIARVPARGLVLIRNVIRESNWRFRATVAEERVSRAFGWMRCETGHFPTREEIESPLRAAGFAIDSAPLWGRTPFNSWLIVARRGDRAVRTPEG